MSTNPGGFTPMMKQYFEVKDQYKDCILMYRLGDFYEMFFEDAITASKVLEITLTGRNCGMEEKAPMCGVPFHSVDSYIAKLVQNGYNVAICEQIEDPKTAATIVNRDVVRVITPGTIMDTEALDDEKNNYLCSIYASKHGMGVAFVDITTGEFSANEIHTGDTEVMLMNAIAKYSPTEVIMNLEAYEKQELVDKIKDRISCFVRNFYDWAFEYEEAEKKIEEQFGKETLELDLLEKPCAISATGALILYLEQTQKTELSNLTTLEVNRDDSKMQLDMYSLRNLEIIENMRDRKPKGSLLSVINKTKTSMGSRLMRRWLLSPLVNCADIQNRHLAVDELIKKPLVRAEIIDALKGIQDIERIVNKVLYKTATCKDLLALRDSFEKLPLLKSCILKCESKLLRSTLRDFDTLKDLYDLIDKTIDDKAPNTVRKGEMIKMGANAEFDEKWTIANNGKEWMKEIVEEEKEATGIKMMKLGYNKVFGYYIEVTKANIDMVPDYFIRKQTLANGERYITPRIKEIEEAILNADSELTELEYKIFCETRDSVGMRYEAIQKTAEVVAIIDVLCSLSTVADKNGYVMPTVNNSGKIIIKDGRHPVVEKLGRNMMFIPNDVTLDNSENQVLVITGPNMAGKSTYMRQVAIIVLLAQIGSFVPAKSAEIGVVDKIFTRVGASDDLAAGQSTFMVEMTEVSYILDNCTKNSLVILDEIGRGTSTFDGLSIAWAVVEYIADCKKCGAKTMFATHYHELTELEDRIPNIKNYCVAVKKSGDEITFLRKIIRGGADESYGVEVAALAGVKGGVIKRAKEVAKILESRDKKTV
ncbi:MAG: DNA mismatch repair protein MutS, partial [Oscillospiraceae bacterium]